MIVLDTHVLIISSISVWEIYLLIKKGRLKLNMDSDSWLANIENIPNLSFVPVDNSIAALSVNLPPPLHEDPADRIIVATALKAGASLITSDKRLLDYPNIQTIW